MRLVLVFLSLLAVAATAGAADPVYLDQLIETPQAVLQEQFPGLRKEGCYRLADGRYLLISMHKKDGKPSRVALAAAPPCRHADDVAISDIRDRRGVDLGDSSVVVVEKMGRPDASADPDPAQRKLGDTEYFYICRVEEGCARHTSIFIREGVVSAIATWYSD